MINITTGSNANMIPIMIRVVFMYLGKSANLSSLFTVITS